MNRRLTALIPLTGLLILAAALFWPGRGGAYHANPVDPPLPMAEFTLGEGAEAFHSHELRGHHTVLFFGFTACPDVCPLTLQKLADARARMGRAAERTRVVFVSVDPERDDAAGADAYAKAFDPSFRGVAGTEEQTRALAADYGIYFRRVDASTHGEHAGHAVDHTASSLVLNPRGELVMLFPYEHTSEEIASDLRRLVRR
jgi:protein SCO1